MKIFYSWQSDQSIPNKINRYFIEGEINRYFIEGALKKAVRKIANDNSIDVIPVIDRDTQGMAGSVSIIETILKKIDESDLIVCDVTIINPGSRKFRKTPNPNVMYELGYAMHLFGDSKIIMVVNTAFGKVEVLPFDIRHRRILTYHLTKDLLNKSEVKHKLIKDLESAIRSIVEKNKDSINSAFNIIQTPKISQLDSLLRKKKLSELRRNWLNSEKSVNETRLAVTDLFDSIEKIYQEEKDKYLDLSINLGRDNDNSHPHLYIWFKNSLFFTISWLLRHENTLDDARLKWVISQNRRFENPIAQNLYKSDIDENENVIWYSETSVETTYSSSDLAKMLFQKFMNQIDELITKSE